MRFSKSTRYALYAAMEMAVRPEPVTVGSVATKYDIPEGALARVMQMLVRVGVAQGVRGTGGGYLLARPAREINLLQLIEVFDPPRPHGEYLLGKNRESDGRDVAEKRLRRLFDEVEENARNTFASVSLETLVRGGATGRLA
jgi:Rrf2 family protein